MQVLNDIKNWVLMENGKAVEFNSTKPRPVTLDFNSAGVAHIAIWLASEDEPRFLCRVDGRETVKFAVDGAYAVMNKTPDVDVFILTSDGGQVHRVALDEERYTTLHTPQPRDENLDKIVARINRSVELRMQQQEHSIRREYEERVNNGHIPDIPDQSEGEGAGSAGGDEAVGDDGQTPPAEPVGQAESGGA